MPFKIGDIVKILPSDNVGTVFAEHFGVVVGIGNIHPQGAIDVKFSPSVDSGFGGGTEDAQKFRADARIVRFNENELKIEENLPATFERADYTDLLWHLDTRYTKSASNCNCQVFGCRKKSRMKIWINEHGVWCTVLVCISHAGEFNGAWTESFMTN